MQSSNVFDYQPDNKVSTYGDINHCTFWHAFNVFLGLSFLLSTPTLQVLMTRWNLNDSLVSPSKSNFYLYVSNASS